MAAEVRVGIVSFNTASLLERCLDALPSALDGLRAEIRVVDNASTDDSVEVARRHAAVDVQRNAANVGYAKAMNDALDETDAPVLIALNPDTEPPVRSLRVLAEHVLADERVGLVVPRLVDPDGTEQPSVHRFPSLGLAAVANLLPARSLRGGLGRRFWIAGAAGQRTTGSIDWAFGAVHVMRRAAAGARPYDERSFMYAEDLDLCWRLHQQGWRVELAGDVAIPHVGNAAGAIHWGDEREDRVWQATYDWYARSRSDAGARLYAALNLTGATTKGVGNLVIGATRRERQTRDWGRQLLRTTRAHMHGVIAPRSD